MQDLLAPGGAGEGVSLTALLGVAAGFLIGAIGFLSLFFFVLGGYKLLTSRGVPDKVQAGKDTLIWATIGVVLSLLSFVILSFIIRTLTGTS